MDFSIRKHLSKPKRPFPKMEAIYWVVLASASFVLVIGSFLMSIESHPDCPPWEDGRTFSDKVTAFDIRRNPQTGQADSYQVLTETSGNCVNLGRNEAESREQGQELKVGQTYNFRYVLGARDWTIYRYDPK